MHIIGVFLMVLAAALYCALWLAVKLIWWLARLVAWAVAQSRSHNATATVTAVAPPIAKQKQNSPPMQLKPSPPPNLTPAAPAAAAPKLSLTDDFRLVRNPNTTIRLDGPVIGSGGEGQIIGFHQPPDYCVKLFNFPDDAKRSKCLKLAEKQAQLFNTNRLRERFAPPIDLVEHTATGRFVGYVMPRVHGAQLLESLVDSAQRAIHWPHAREKFIAEVAYEVFWIVAAAHAREMVLGDITPRNFLVNLQRPLVTVIDLDSAQLGLPASPTVLISGVTTPPYGAPELYRSGVPDERHPTSDIFSAAAVIYELLTGGTGFTDGRVTGVNCGPLPPDEQERVTRGIWANSTRTQEWKSQGIWLDPPRTAVSYDVFGHEIGELLFRVFDDGFLDPLKRPTAREFVAALRKYADALVLCPAMRHQMHGELTYCPWCERETRVSRLVRQGVI